MKKLPFELVFWLVALFWLSMINPTGDHFSLCLFHHLGITWCPGCGIGHAISFALHGDLMTSFQTHFMGIPALVIISHRILTLMGTGLHLRNLRSVKPQNHTYEQ